MTSIEIPATTAHDLSSPLSFSWVKLIAGTIFLLLGALMLVPNIAFLALFAAARLGLDGCRGALQAILYAGEIVGCR